MIYLLYLFIFGLLAVATRPPLTCLVELKELLFEPISLGLLAVASEPLHPVSAPAWSLGAH